MDANLVLLWMVCAWWLLGVRTALQGARHGRPAWLCAYALVALVMGAAHLLWPSIAGFWGACAYAGVVLGPTLLQRRATRLSGLQHYERARNAARLAAWLHPADGYPELVEVLAAMAKARAGLIDEAQLELRRIAREGSAGIRNLAALYLFRMRGEWALYLQLTDDIADRIVASDPSLLVGRMRALGEMGRIEELIAMYATHAGALSAPALAQVRASAQLFVAAFCGKPQLVQQLGRSSDNRGPEACGARQGRTSERLTVHE